MEGEEALSEQLFELTQYANIFKRLLKKAQALVRSLSSEIDQLQRAGHLATFLAWHLCEDFCRSSVECCTLGC